MIGPSLAAAPGSDYVIGPSDHQEGSGSGHVIGPSLLRDRTFGSRSGHVIGPSLAAAPGSDYVIGPSDQEAAT